MEHLPSPLCYNVHVTNYPREGEDNVVNFGTITRPGPFVVCTREVLLTAASLPFAVAPSRGMGSSEDDQIRFESNLQLLREWANAKDMVLHPNEIAARATIGELPLDMERGAQGPWVTIVNPEEHAYCTLLYAFEFGGAGTTNLAVWSDSPDDALETAAEWLSEHAPGHITAFGSAELQRRIDDARELLGEEADDDTVMDSATEGLTNTESGYLCSHEHWYREADTEFVVRVQAICELLHPDTVRWDA